ncbi:hypothetical protein Tco_1029073 [Tanacetum coccineum]|uniref:Retrovirus-related Pol polyprotein from transposon TNT 1-94-like beta-barrel domain-containing protein n=1 Tax=Tanacetum coccineum TaxID=301880 RepID=A0ABQ5G4M9_9ASTR
MPCFSKTTQSTGKPQQDDTRFVDSGCSRHMTGNIAYLSNFKEFDGGYVIFGGGAHGGRISGKGTLKTDSLDFEDLPDESQILLKIPRKDNMYSFDMKNIVPKESLTCLVTKATSDESMLWHRHVKRGRDTKIPQSSGPPVKVGDEAVHKELGDRMERAATTASSLEAEQDSVPSSTSQPPITPTEEPTLMPHESPLHGVHLLRRDEGSMQQHELMDLVTKLIDKIGVLEKDLQQTKKTYNTTLTRLVLRVKKLEKTVKTGKVRRRARIVISEDEDAAEDSSK